MFVCILSAKLFYGVFVCWFKKKKSLISNKGNDNDYSESIFASRSAMRAKE